MSKYLQSIWKQPAHMGPKADYFDNLYRKHWLVLSPANRSLHISVLAAVIN